MAGKMKGLVTIAYWDTEQSGRPPSLIGQIKGTPTIKFYRPAAGKGKRGNKKKVILDYNGERKAQDMRKYALEQMPSFVERISGVDGKRGLKAFHAKAAKYGLPSAVAFSSKSGNPMLKHASTALRRRLLIGEVTELKSNAAVKKELGVSTAPALMVFLPPAEEGAEARKVDYNEKKFSLRRVEAFLSKHALKAAVGRKKKATKTNAERGGGGGSGDEAKAEKEKKKTKTKTEKKKKNRRKAKAEL